MFLKSDMYAELCHAYIKTFRLLMFLRTPLLGFLLGEGTHRRAYLMLQADAQ